VYLQVWFQNSRARDRREGRPPQSFGSKGSGALSPSIPASLYNGFQVSRLAGLAGIPGGWSMNSGKREVSTSSQRSEADHSESETGGGSGNSTAIDVSSGMQAVVGSGGEQPLDLSTKKSTPSNSPGPSTITSEVTSDSEDASGLNTQPLNLVRLRSYYFCLLCYASYKISKILNHNDFF